MASDAFTNNPARPRGAADESTIEYNLLLEDHLALFLFGYDLARAARRSGGLFHGLCSVAVIALTLTLSVLENERWRHILSIGLLVFLALYLLHYLRPGRLFDGVSRSFYEGRMRRLIRENQRVGLYNPRRHDRVVMRADCFIESNDLYDDFTSGVAITEHRETRVEWSAVSRIDMLGEHAIFTVVERGYLILPRRAFADEASFLAFVGRAKRYQEAAQKSPAALIPSDMLINSAFSHNQPEA